MVCDQIKNLLSLQERVDSGKRRRTTEENSDNVRTLANYFSTFPDPGLMIGENRVCGCDRMTRRRHTCLRSAIRTTTSCRTTGTRTGRTDECLQHELDKSIGPRGWRRDNFFSSSSHHILFFFSPDGYTTLHPHPWHDQPRRIRIKRSRGQFLSRTKFIASFTLEYDTSTRGMIKT